MSPTVSVILPTYNRPRFLEQAIQSVRSQIFSDWELIVADNASTPETKKVVDSFLSDRRIRYLRCNTPGTVAKTRNHGMTEAGGRYFAFLDDDDLFLPEKLERQVAWMEEHPKTGLLYCRTRVMDGNRRILRTLPPRPGRSFLELYLENFIQVSSVLVKRLCFETVGTFDDDMAGSEDYFVWLRIAERFPIDYLPETLAVYRQHGHNKSRFPIRQWHNRLKILSRFEPDPASGLTPKMKNRCLAATHYRLARVYREEREYLRAAGHFARAFRFDPLIGTLMKDPCTPGLEWGLQLLKPYGGALFCAVKGCLEPKGAAR